MIGLIRVLIDSMLMPTGWMRLKSTMGFLGHYPSRKEPILELDLVETPKAAV